MHEDRNEVRTAREVFQQRRVRAAQRLARRAGLSLRRIRDEDGEAAYRLLQRTGEPLQPDKPMGDALDEIRARLS